MGKSSRSTAKVSAKAKTSPRRSAPPPAPPQEKVVPIPPEVSRRMVRRMLVFCGIPSGIGLSSFVVNYYLLVNHVVAIPSYFTLVESLVCFGLGFLGISYGVFSASWDPEPGSLLGLREFRRNLGYTLQQWREWAATRNASDAGDSAS